MTTTKAYSRINSRWRMFPDSGSFFLLLFLLFLIPFVRSNAQDESEYDEIAVYLDVKGVGGIEIPAVIKGEELYLPVTDLFDYMRIRNLPTAGLDSISGFFLNKESAFYINRINNRIVYQEKVYNLKPGDMIRTESNLYLKSSYFGTIFGLECDFNFRALSVTLTSKVELPVIREMKIEEMRRNLNKIKGELKVDTTIGPSRPLFRFGMADWGVYANEEINGRTNTTVNMSLGAMVAGGEATGSLYYNNLGKFSERQQQYMWRYVNNDFKPLRQLMAGKISTHAISTLYNPVIGIQLTNTPTTFRKSFGSYTLNDYTDPGWIVELYINNVLVDFVKADASGFFTFDIPLVYGNSSVKLKFYGPWGEEKIKEQNINIPYNFLPEKTFEYNIGAGIIEDSVGSIFSRANFSYGLSKGITLGGGIEYVSSVTSGPIMPFVNGSFRITNNMLLSGEYAYGVRAKGSFLYRLPSNIQMDLNYTLYEKGQTAINFNYREERKAALSVPIRIANIPTYQRFSVSQIILPSSYLITGEWLFSGLLFGVNTNLTTYAYLSGYAEPFAYSNLSLAFRLPANFTLMPQLQWRYAQKPLVSSKVRVEKTIADKAYLYFQYERFFKNNLNLAELGFRYDFSFAQTGLSFRHNAGRNTFVQYARGSIISDPKTKYLAGDNRTNVGRGGITVIPFLDLNADGKKDKGEPKVEGLNIRANGGRIVRNENDTTIRILGLEPYTNSFLEIDPNSFENISWRPGIKTLGVYIDPDILKSVEIPVNIAGEASGEVRIEKQGMKEGLGRIIILFVNSNNKTIARTLTEDNGYYSYLGFKPGQYTVRVDTGQLKKLNLVSDPDLLQFSFKAGPEGGFVEGLDFTLRAKVKPETEKPAGAVAEQPVIRKDTVYMIIHEVSQELVTIDKDSYAIQLGAFKRRANAEAYKRKIEKLFGKDVQIVIEGDFFKVRISDINDRAEVDQKVEILRQNGVTELWIISLKAKQQQLILIEKQDTISKIIETEMDVRDSIVSPERIIQIGAFRREANALSLRDKLPDRLKKQAIIINEGGYFKVQITGLRNLTELKQTLSSLGSMGLSDIWIPSVKRQKPAEPQVIEKPVTAVPDTAGKAVEKKIEEEIKVPAIEEPPAVREPTVSLHVAAFHRKAQALRAQRKIESKLHLPVEIVPQWEYYHVIVTGFYTREETMKYYPELAGIGFPNISLIEKK